MPIAAFRRALARVCEDYGLVGDLVKEITVLMRPATQQWLAHEKAKDGM
jgi:hypothetical protein